MKIRNADGFTARSLLSLSLPSQTSIPWVLCSQPVSSLDAITFPRSFGQCKCKPQRQKSLSCSLSLSAKKSGKAGGLWYEVHKDGGVPESRWSEMGSEEAHRRASLSATPQTLTHNGPEARGGLKGYGHYLCHHPGHCSAFPVQPAFPLCSPGEGR